MLQPQNDPQTEIHANMRAFAILGLPVAVGGSEKGSVINAFVTTVDDANVGFSFQLLLF